MTTSIRPFRPWLAGTSVERGSGEWARLLNNLATALNTTDTDLLTELRAFVDDLYTELDGLTGDVTELQSQQHNIRHERVSTGSVAGGATVNVTLTWTIPFPSTGYTVVAQLEYLGGVGAGLHLDRIESRTASTTVVAVTNAGGPAATGIVHAIAIADN